ncbi:unnamed protein product [Caenorhabditis bovis]|uniref:Uncharacterized protein n=1 Tax=Caenorhabditis bovis TaxID=2654633 RepID=A0A8S1ESI1_9PELO|nr:unnamed protein product [Caenorhabditis bovis]
MIDNKEGIVEDVHGDKIVVRYEKVSVLFDGVSTKKFAVNDIVTFSADSALPSDHTIFQKFFKNSKNLEFKGKNIKLKKKAHIAYGKGIVVEVRQNFMIVQWDEVFPNIKKNNHKVLCLPSAMRPRRDNVNSEFKIGDIAQFYAYEQPPSRSMASWRAKIFTHESNKIIEEVVNNQTVYTVEEKQSKSSKLEVVKNGNAAPSLPLTNKPPPVAGYDFNDCSEKACEARFNAFVDKLRIESPDSILLRDGFGILLQLKYLKEVQETMQALSVADFL